MRTTMNISLPPALKQWVDRQIDEGGFSTASEYVRQLIREEQKRQLRLAIEAKLEEGEASGEPVPVTERTWKDTNERVMQRLHSKARKRRRNGKDL